MASEIATRIATGFALWIIKKVFRKAEDSVGKWPPPFSAIYIRDKIGELRRMKQAHQTATDIEDIGRKPKHKRARRLDRDDIITAGTYIRYFVEPWYYRDFHEKVFLAKKPVVAFIHVDGSTRPYPADEMSAAFKEAAKMHVDIRVEGFSRIDFIEFEMKKEKLLPNQPMWNLLIEKGLCEAEVSSFILSAPTRRGGPVLVRLELPEFKDFFGLE